MFEECAKILFWDIHTCSWNSKKKLFLSEEKYIRKLRATFSIISINKKTFYFHHLLHLLTFKYILIHQKLVGECGEGVQLSTLLPQWLLRQWGVIEVAGSFFLWWSGFLLIGIQRPYMDLWFQHYIFIIFLFLNLNIL